MVFLFLSLFFPGSAPRGNRFSLIVQVPRVFRSSLRCFRSSFKCVLVSGSSSVVVIIIECLSSVFAVLTSGGNRSSLGLSCPGVRGDCAKFAQVKLAG